jgi:hypothetical protein
MALKRNNKAQGKPSMSQNLSLVFESIHVFNDNDAGSGEIYIDWSANDEINTARGRLGTYDIHSGHSGGVSEHLHTFFDVDEVISLNFNVRESDWGSDDYLGNVSVSFSAAENFGIGRHENVMSSDGESALTFLISPV